VIAFVADDGARLAWLATDTGRCRTPWSRLVFEARAGGAAKADPTIAKTAASSVVRAILRCTLLQPLSDR
jgi:hypothetical protein